MKKLFVDDGLVSPIGKHAQHVGAHKINRPVVQGCEPIKKPQGHQTQKRQTQFKLGVIDANFFSRRKEIGQKTVNANS